MSFNTDHNLHSLPAFPTRTVLGVKFFSGSLKDVIDHVIHGGLVVVPSGPGLANDLPRDPAYRDALVSADLVLPDSGLMALWWNRSHSNEEERLPRLSGLLFLKEFIKREAQGVLQDSFWIMPDAGQDAHNRGWLAEEAGLVIETKDVYLAPAYTGAGLLVDESLLRLLAERRPKVIMVNIGGGVQERLGHYLRDNLNYHPIIICTGAALAFLSGQQVRIPLWADRVYLGWLLRCIANPVRFIPRYWAARKLVGLLKRYGADSPLPLETEPT
ncbi:MAG: WecB/TagA/CpsF family glycosyltransferase [Opitutae bacterium]|nr:WecB/TagA/CpsF family glycosyltransferase [Opitutae bacterium]MBT5908791.1 WecB/TagA/CpsF family glycosyltransferase [Opitutae bacterium]MBT6851074.1 WecB/TagA/CpsF family glycosyltransferase [Opitutae bacterium]MBT7740644.1 WecB/TagA/CpsF family glycosyltransferase [Opitutae bacterium]MBT7924395.1 WecB/TagA/CpsF family glycosyltransferase [Opitutae bacterium]